MSDNRRVYNQVLKTLKKLMPTTKQTYVVTLAMMISGIVTGKKAQLSTMSGEIPSQTAKSASIEMHTGKKKPPINRWRISPKKREPFLTLLLLLDVWGKPFDREFLLRPGCQSISVNLSTCLAL